MAVVGGDVGSSFDVVGTVLGFARVIANDCSVSIDGDILADTQPYVMTLMSLAWRKLQDRVSNNALEDFPQEQIITLPKMDSTVIADYASQCALSSSGYFDGVALQPAPILPSNMYLPIRLWERPAGQMSQFTPMTCSYEGLNPRAKTGNLITWEWSGGALRFVGATLDNEVRIRFKQKFDDPKDKDSIIPLADCAVSLAYLAVEILSQSRGGTILPVLAKEKEDAIKQLINATTRKRQRTNFRRKPYSRRGNRLS